MISIFECEHSDVRDECKNAGPPALGSITLSYEMSYRTASRDPVPARNQSALPDVAMAVESAWVAKAGRRFYEMHRQQPVTYEARRFSFTIVGVPARYTFVDNGLNRFTEHISIGASAFVIAGVAVLTIAWLSVSSLSWNAARSNPVDSLREE